MALFCKCGACRLGDAEAGILLQRFGGEVAATVIERRGAVRVAVMH